jgi:hypothetical protein
MKSYTRRQLPVSLSKALSSTSILSLLVEDHA